MPARREFLGWHEPALLAAVKFLRTRYAHKSQWNLGQAIVVVPGRRAGRRLLELLVFEAEAAKLDLTPPEITTEGGLPEKLYAPRFPFADPLCQDSAWSAALRELDPRIAAAIIPHPPDRSDEGAWLELAKILRVQHAELAAEMLDFAAVARRGRELNGFPDTARWEAMASVQNAYLRLLDDLKLWDVQTARLVAVQQREITAEKDILLLGTVDLSRTMRAILDLAAERVTALIAAPESEAARFDAYGCVIPSQWLECELPLRDEQIVRVGGAEDQAEATVELIAGFAGRYRADEISVGVPDERLVSPLQRRFEQCGAAARFVEGTSVLESGPALLLAAVSEFLREPTATAFASLARHPDLFALWTAGDEAARVPLDFLNELDRLTADHMLGEIEPQYWPFAARKAAEEKKDFTGVFKAVELWRESIATLEGSRRLLGAWSEPILDFLRMVYSPSLKLSAEEARVIGVALEEIRGALASQATLPARLQPETTAAEAIQWALRRLGSAFVPPPAQADAIELLGWLELPLDDAPALIVTTFNEGFLPESSSADTFLPNRLRNALGLIDNDRRYARDCYSLRLLAESRREFALITARRDPEENPLLPSRLAFASDQAALVRRAEAYFRPLPESPPPEPLIGARFAIPAQERLLVPSPPEQADLERMSMRVTQFRDYLACPYRFYLKHIARLNGPAEADDELHGGAFGDLLHAVFESFGRAEAVRESTISKEIAHYLGEELDRRAAIRYGDRRRSAIVDLQIAQMRLRLERFAAWQAERTRNGWRIAWSESTEEGQGNEWTHPFEVDGRPITLRGRIDRIDRHEDGHRIDVLDYKTADAGEKPERTHRKKGEWIDLQLPLYRRLAHAAGMNGEIRLGYILVPKSLEEIGEAIADWSDADLLSAEEAARNVVRGIRAGRFWPPSGPPAYDDPFTPICQDRRLGGPAYGSSLEEDVP